MSHKFESIATKAVEIKEIALQIMNIMDTKDTLWSSFAYTYLEALTNGKMEEASKYYGSTVAKAYEVQILYCLSNLEKWRGNDAKHYKALLKEYLKYFEGKQNTGKLSESINPMWQVIRGIGD